MPDFNGIKYPYTAQGLKAMKLAMKEAQKPQPKAKAQEKKNAKR